MSLTRLSLTCFRSYAAAEILPGQGFVVLTGDNGAGKTNILEAVSLFSPGRGLRGAALSDMALAEGPGGFSISIRLPSGDASTIDLGTGTLATAPDRRVVRINGVSAAAAAFGEWLSLVWLTPAQDRLFSATAGERRRFLDRLVLAVDPAHGHDATRYEAAMRQRNRLLAEERADVDWLRALELAMADHGARVAERRAALVAALRQRITGQAEGPFARAGLALDGWDVTGDFARDLAAGRARDGAAGRTLIGPHRQDLLVTHLDKGTSAANSSTGEQKALLLGIVLAHADLVAERQSRRPVLLLDEVAAHLDPTRRAALFERLAAAGGQVWMTGTEPALFAAVPASATRLAVGPGTIGVS